MKRMIVGLIAVAVSAGIALAGPGMTRTWSAEDLGPALRIQNGYSVPVTFTVSTTSLTFSCQGDTVGGTNNINMALAAYNTMGEVFTAVRAFTNSAGKKLLQVDSYSALAADISSNRLLAASYTIQPGQWGTAATWDTSVSLTFDCYSPGDTVGGTMGDRVLKSVYGSIGGTSNITLNAYVDGTEVWEKVIRTPVYVFNTTLTNDTATATVLTEIDAAEIMFDLPLPVARSESLIIRASRFTTATTGGIGMILEETR